MSDVIATLLAAGWRWEILDSAERPCLTNAPPGQTFCIACGTWQASATFNALACRRCALIQRQRSVQKKPEFYHGYSRGYNRAYYLRRREKRLVYAKQYYSRHRERLNAQRRERYAARRRTLQQEHAPD
jgi:hypothetical protein